MKKDKGFTLVEMMTVIAITAIVSTIAIPNIYSFAAGMKRRSACQDFYSALQKTRMNAIRQNNRWAVEFTASNYKITDCGPDNVCGGTGTGDNKPSSTTNFSDYPGVSIPSIPGTLEFYPDGTCSAAITLKFETTENSTTKTSQVDVLASGRIKTS